MGKGIIALQSREASRDVFGATPRVGHRSHALHARWVEEALARDRVVFYQVSVFRFVLCWIVARDDT